MKQALLSPEERESPQEVSKPLGFLSQAWLLTHKNVILTIKNPKNLIFLILTPFLLSAFMAIFQSLAESSGERTLENPPVRELPKFPHCYGQNCYSLDYRVIRGSQSPTNSDWIDFVIEYVKTKAGFEDSDVNRGQPINSVQKLKEYYEQYSSKPNKTQIGLLFCEGIPEEVQLNFFCNGTNKYSYYMVLNKTDSLSVIFHDLLQPLPIDEVAASLKLLVDNALLNYIDNRTANEPSRINYTTSQFPVGINRYIQGYDIVTSIGAFYYLITPLFAFLFIQSQIVREKQYKLRQGLNVFGASHGAYWLSWFVVANIYAVVTAISTYLAGLVFQFGFFTQTPFYILVFFVLYPFTLAMQMMSFFLSTLSSTLKTANAISYGIVLFAIVVQSFVSDNNLLVFLFSDDVSPLIFFLKYFLSLYPPFSYTKIFTNITAYSGKHFDFNTRRWVQGITPYTLNTFSQDISHQPLPIGKQTYSRYSDMSSMFIIFGDIIFYILLTWYFDHIVSSNRGRGDPFYFPLSKIWKFFIKKRQNRRISPQQTEFNHANLKISEEEESTIRQRNRVFMNSKNNIAALGMRIKCLNKTFKSMFSSNRVEAIRNFNLEIEPNELMGILGHNGAGKTTLINILTGVLKPDDNEDMEIFISNQSLQNIDEIRKYIGVCSQFDILWNEMTAEEHLYMFARLKNIPLSQIDRRIDQILGFVNLTKQKKNRVKGFSGGMKRRLSLAIAAIGRPKIILLDEPTTGLDPKVRQQVWKLIEKLKKGKSIILTTHSMEEADILADRLCVMVKGSLKCVGTSFYLKKNYGEGHRITLNIENTKSKEVMELITKLVPEAKQVDCKGGNLIVGMESFEQLLKMVKMLEAKDSLGLDQYSLKQYIKDWSVSHSTLEEVFMKVTKERDSS